MENNQDLLQVGKTYLESKDYKEAEKSFQKALDALLETKGKYDEKTAGAYTWLGWTYYESENYSKALESYQTAYEILLKIFGSEHKDTKIVKMSIGHVYRNIAGLEDDDKKAIEYFKKVLEIYEEDLGLEHIDTAEIYSRLGTLYSLQDECDEALAWHIKALTAYEKVLEKDDPILGNAYGRVGTSFTRVDSGADDDYKIAEINLIKAINILENSSENDTFAFACDYARLAEIYIYREDYPKALELLKKALPIHEKYVEEELHSKMVANDYRNIGYIYDKQNNLNEALEWYTEAVNRLEILYGADDPQTISIRALLDGVKERMD